MGVGRGQLFVARQALPHHILKATQAGLVRIVHDLGEWIIRHRINPPPDGHPHDLALAKQSGRDRQLVGSLGQPQVGLIHLQPSR